MEKRTFLKVFTFALTSIILYPMNGYGRSPRQQKNRSSYGYGPYGSRFSAYGNGYGVYGGEYGAYMNSYGRRNGRSLPQHGSPTEEVHRHNNGDVSQ